MPGVIALPEAAVNREGDAVDGLGEGQHCHIQVDGQELVTQANS